MARVRGTTSDFQPQNYIFGSPCNFCVAKEMVLVRRGVLGDVHRFFSFLNRFLGGFRFFWHFMVRKVVLGGRIQFWRKNWFHGGSTEVARRFHGGSTEVRRRFRARHQKTAAICGEIPTFPKTLTCSVVRSEFAPMLVVNPPLFKHVGCVSCRVGLWTPSWRRTQMLLFCVGFLHGFRLGDLVLFFMVFHVRFTSLMLGAFKFTVWKAAEHHKGCPCIE